MRKALSIVLAGTMMLSLAACGASKAVETTAAVTETELKTEGEAEAGKGGEKKHYKLGYAFSNIDENNQRSLTAIQKRIEELNKAGAVEIELIYTDAQAQVDKQISDVESLIAQSPDLIMVSAVDTVGSVPCAQAVHNAGIISVDDRGMKDDSIDFMFQGMNEDAIKEMKKQYLVDYLEANPDVVLNFGLINGLASQSEQLKRNQDVIELAKEMPDRVKVLDSQFADWSTDKATSITEDWLQRYPEMNAISTASDDMTLGVCNALSANGKEGFLTMGVDGTKIGCELVKAGKMTVTIKANIPMIYKQWVDICVQAVDGTFTEDYYSPGTDALVAVTIDNVDENLAENQ